MSCKSTLEAAKSGYFTSVASEMGTSSPKIGWCSRKVLVCTYFIENQGWRTLKCHVRMENQPENGSENGPSCAKQPEIEDGPKTVAHEKSA